MPLDMRNVAYSEAYKADKEELIAEVAVPAFFTKEYVTELSEGYRVLSAVYEKPYRKPEYAPMHVNRVRLVNAGGEVLYTYWTYDGYGVPLGVLNHANGKRYYVFTRELYGYSVLDLQTLKDLHYVPAASFFPYQEDNPDFEETFIWRTLYYNPLNSVLAVEGCIWAGPYSVVLSDFSDPMLAHPWVCVDEKLYGRDYCLDFVAWRCLDLVIQDTTDKEHEIILKQEEYTPWLLGEETPG